MSEYKNQHFVPRFYLANFAFNDGAQTNLIRTVTLKAIPRIGVTGQCQEDFFYGKNLKMEKALSVIEGSCRKVIGEILRDGRLAALGTPQDALLKTFICLQWIRTREFAAGFDGSMSKMLKAVYRERFREAGFTDEQLADVEIHRAEGPRESVGQGVDFIPFFWDLDAKLILANDLGEFVTSDNPVVMLNPHYLGRFEGGVTAPALEGTVLLFPIAPEYLVILYDRRCYRVGASGNPIVPLGSITDLVALNNHQFLNADQCVYHRGTDRAAAHVAEFGRVQHLRVAERQVVREIKMRDGKTLVHTFIRPIEYKPATAFLRVLRSRRDETAAVSQVPPRDHHLSQHFEEYTKAVNAKKAPRGFANYIADIATAVLSPDERAKLDAQIAAAQAKS